MGRLGAQVAVELGGQAVQPVPAGREVDPGGGVGLAFGQRDLPGEKQFSAADGRHPRQQPPRGHRRRPGQLPVPSQPVPSLPVRLLPGPAVHHAQAGGHPFDPVHRVTAPRHVRAEHLSPAEPEAGHARDHHRGRVVPGVPAAALAQPQPVAEPVPLRDALGGRPPGEVQDLTHLPGERENHLQAVHHVRLAAGVGHRVPDPDRTSGNRLRLGHQAQAGGSVLRLDPGPPLPVPGADRPEHRRPVVPGGRVAAGGQPVAGQAGAAEPALAVLGQQRAGPDRLEQRRGVAWLQPAVRHRAGPHCRQGARPGEQDQPGPGCKARIRHQPRARVPGLLCPAWRIPTLGHATLGHRTSGHPTSGRGPRIVTGGHSSSDLRPGRTVRWGKSGAGPSEAGCPGRALSRWSGTRPRGHRASGAGPPAGPGRSGHGRTGR